MFDCQRGAFVTLPNRDIDSAGEQIHVSRRWTASRLGRTKSQANRAAVPMHKVLADHLQVGHHGSVAAHPDHGWITGAGKRPKDGLNHSE
jgi:hypothetical protein